VGLRLQTPHGVCKGRDADATSRASALLSDHARLVDMPRPASGIIEHSSLRGSQHFVNGLRWPKRWPSSKGFG
jgi:hypothetical protein